MDAVSVVSPAPRDAWTRVLAEYPGATPYQTPDWFDAVRSVSAAGDASRLYELPDGRRLVLPLLRRSLLPGLYLDGSYPGTYGSGGLLASGGLRTSDVSLVLTDLLRGPALAFTIKANHDTFSQWEAGTVTGVTNTPRRVEVLDLDGGFAHIWDKRFRSRVRQPVKKAERHGLSVERDTTGRLVPQFYELYMEWTARRALTSGVPRRVALVRAKRREPLSKFQAVAAIPGDECRVWVALHQGEPVASIITLVHGDHAIYWRGYSNAVAGAVGANHLLQRMAIEDACVSGCRFYSMGESGGVESLVLFKQGFGATPRRGVEVRFERLPIRRAQALANVLERRAAQAVMTSRRALQAR